MGDAGHGRDQVEALVAVVVSPWGWDLGGNSRCQVSGCANPSVATTWAYFSPESAQGILPSV